MQLYIDLGNDTCKLAFAPNSNIDKRTTIYAYSSNAYMNLQARGWIVGKEADKQGMNDTVRYVRSFPRDLESGRPYVMGSDTYPVQTVMAAMFWRMKRDAGIGNIPASAVVIVPPAYSERHHDLIQQAGLDAGFVRVELLDSPIAIAAHYRDTNDFFDKESVLVYDLGAMFNASVVQQQNGRYVRLGRAIYSEQHGGIAFDGLIYNQLTQSLLSSQQDLNNLLDQSDKTRDALLLRFMLQDFCKSLKHQLSEQNEVQGVIPSGVPLVAGIPFALTRQDLESMGNPLIEETAQYCNMLANNIAGGWQSIRHVLLVGKSCTLPFVKGTLERCLNRPVQTIQKLHTAACLGAVAYYSGRTSTDLSALFEALLGFITNTPIPSRHLQIVPLLTYGQAIEYFVKRRPADPRVQKGAMLRQPHKRGQIFTQLFLDEYNTPVRGPDGKTYINQLIAERFDSELRDTFAGEQLVIVE